VVGVGLGLHMCIDGTAGKGKQMMVGGTKSKTAFQDGYFRKNFDRIMEVCDP